MVNFNKETREISSKFTMKNLPAEVARQVEKMKVGEISKAFVYTTEQGRDVCAVIKLKSRVDSHRATLTEDFQVLRNVVLEKRRAEKLETWIKEKQRSTYVRINPEWRNCDFKYPEWNK
jgi:peptidyl-prolyl cis-trans isomerase SurA